MILSPSLLSANMAALGQELARLEEAGLSWVHWDVMDGSFVPNITFGQHVVKLLRPHSKLFFDVHLMIEAPERHLEDFARAGANMLVIHAEATRHIQRTLAAIRGLGLQAGLALNPATPLNTLDYVMADVDMVLLMSVNPGFGGQSFLPTTYRKLEDLRNKRLQSGQNFLIQVDGGVSVDNTASLVQKGADVLVSGSAFFNAPSYGVRLAEFMHASVQQTV